ncbi:SpoIIE family protein phosphatase [Paraglaciecola sp. 2405UD69-4]|uniref:ATP-binding SpoIIE family protein phosphatase n=1 Tax=Paraglaciecola sp. 2405UD69-4 TaxID=3391836 RepID=UPI0039C9283A
MRILIIDDDSLNRFLLTHMLEQQGYLDTFEAQDGETALKVAAQVSPDLVLLDVVMPGIDGYEVAKRLKKKAGDIYLPIIFITGLDDEAALVKCLAVGGDDFVAKPFDKVILSAKIRAHARTRQLSKRAYEQNKQLTFYRNAIEREHQIVEHIFNNALAIDEFYTEYIDYCLTPASTFNGDLFLACASPNGGFYFLIGDFTGHGLASAIGAIPVSQAFQAMSKKGLSLMEMSETINQILLSLLPDNMFFAALIVEVSHSGKQIDVWNGGMPALLVQGRDGNIKSRFESRHMALGILEKHEFESEVERYELNYGERLIGFSDGIIELQPRDGRMLGEVGLESWLIENPDIDTKGVLLNVKEYLAGEEQQDDVTVVIYTSQQLTQSCKPESVSQLPLKIISDISIDYMQAFDPIVELVNIVTNELGLFAHHSELFTILSELYNNALEHGVLGLDSSLKETDEGFYEYYNLREAKLASIVQAKITISIEYIPKEKRLSLQVEDSGTGFDVKKISQGNSLENSYGRGIPLVRSLCETIEYSHCGRSVSVLFKI